MDDIGQNKVRPPLRSSSCSFFLCAERSVRQLPAAQRELVETHKSIAPIAKYCRDAYAQGNHDEVYKTTVKYTTDVVTNIAYHTFNVVTQLTAYLEAQTSAVTQLDLQLQTISLRLAAMKEATGAQGLRRTDALKSFERLEKLAKLGDDQIAPNSQPLGAWKRLPFGVHYDKPDSINAAVAGRGDGSNDKDDD